MPSKRKFYRTKISVEVLSEEKVLFNNLGEVHRAIILGDCSGLVEDIVQNEELDAMTTVERLQAHASDPEFFNLTEAGEDNADCVESELS